MMMFFRCLITFFVTVTAVFFSGCAAPRFTPTRYYTVQPLIEVSDFEPTDAILGVRPLSLQGVYLQRMIYREADHVLHNYIGSEWAVVPDQAAFRVLVEALIATRRFADVDKVVDLPRPDYILLGSLHRFEEDRTRIPAAAVVEARLTLRRIDDQNLVWSEVIYSREPLDQSGPSGYAEAMSTALGRWASEAADKISLAVD